MFLFTSLFVIATGASILRGAAVLGAATSCGRCSCERAAVDSGRSILFVNCSKSGMSENVPVPTFESYNYTELRAEFERNKITTIQYAIFKGLPITYLSLRDNEIRNIAVGSLAKMPKLRELNLSRNKLAVTLDAKVFQGLENLEILDLTENGILNLESTVFYSLQSLKVLKLSMNFFKEIPSDLFMSVKNLEVLHLNQNALTSIHKATFHTLNKLTHLDVSGNNIDELDDNLFKVATRLTSLNVSSNDITSLSPYIFKVLKGLEILDLSRNRLKGVGKELSLPKSLKVLDIGHNKIKDAGLLFQDFDDLQELYVQDNMFDKLDVVTALTKLQILNISSNILKAFPLQTYPLLRVLDLSNNLFPAIPPVITGQYLPSLNHLTLDANPISQLKFPPTKATFFNLTYVSLSRLAALREIPARAFTTLVSSSTAGRYVEGGVSSEDLARKKRDTNEDEPLLPETHPITKSTSKPVDNITPVEEEEFVKFLAPALLDSVSERAEPQNKVEPIQQVVATSRKSVVIRESKEVEELEEGGRSEGGAVTSKEVEELEVGLKKSVMKEFDGSKEMVTDVDEKERGKVSREVVEEARNVDDERGWAMESEEGDKLGSLRKEPGVMVAVSEVRQYENVHVEAAVSDCRSGLTLRIASNKNLMKIHADAFKGIDICELDLSSNSLTSIPENVVDWSAVRSVDLQGNPWDCSCKLQWLLNVLVPKLYKQRPEMLYELRCATPAVLTERRFVHFFNWTEPAFCMDHKFEQVQKVRGTDQKEETISFGSSTGMLVAIGSALTLIVLMVGMGVIYQWRVVNKRRRIRNRRA